MSQPLSPREEARRLADSIYDRRISAEGMQRLDELITKDIGCLQAYLERIDFHGALLDYAIDRRPGHPAAAAMNQISRNQTRQARRNAWGMSLILSTCAVLFLGLIVWVYSSIHALPPGIGTIASLTLNLSTDSPLELGDVVRKGKVFQLAEGIVSLQLPHVSVNVLGPAKVRLNDSNDLELLSGSLHAYVSPGGEGFTVRTADSVIVDQGTEFAVTYSTDSGTEVSVRRGRVQASLLDRLGNSLRLQELTTARTSLFSRHQNSIHETDYRPEQFLRVDRSRGTIRSIDGTLRTIDVPPLSVMSEALPTRNHMLVIPEQSQVELQTDVTINGISGTVTLRAGTIVSSYLIHYDPDVLMTRAPRGAVTFNGRVAVIAVGAGPLAQTDDLFGLAGTTYEKSTFRELELDEDEVRVSDDQETVFFHFGVTGAEPLDQARVLVIHDR